MTIYFQRQSISIATQDPQKETILLIQAIATALFQSYPERFNK